MINGFGTNQVPTAISTVTYCCVHTAVTCCGSTGLQSRTYLDELRYHDGRPRDTIEIMQSRYLPRSSELHLYTLNCYGVKTVTMSQNQCVTAQCVHGLSVRNMCYFSHRWIIMYPYSYTIKRISIYKSTILSDILH